MGVIPLSDASRRPARVPVITASIIAVNALNGEVTEASWRTKPSWYLVATDDRMIPPVAQRFMSKRAGSTVRESPGSHAIYVSRPAPVVALIEQAARALQPASR